MIGSQRSGRRPQDTLQHAAAEPPQGRKNIGGLMMYYYILGFGIACLVLFGIDSMETVCVKPAEMLVKALFWPVTLMEAVVNHSSTHHNYKAAL